MLLPCQKGGKGQSEGKGKQGHLWIWIADDSGQLINALTGTVELDCKGFLAPFSFSAELDSGSQGTGNTHTVFNCSFPHNILKQPTQSLINFDGLPVNCVQGYFMTKAHFEGSSCSAQVYILDNTCASSDWPGPDDSSRYVP